MTTATQQLEKYMFDRVFEDTEVLPEEPPEAEESAVEGDTTESEEPVEEEVPTFSEEEVAEARQQGFAAGKEEGIRETASSLEQHTAAAVDAIAQQMATMFQAHVEANEKTATDAVNVAATIARKLLPGLAERNATGEIEHMVASVIPRLMDEPRIVIRVHPDLREPVAERIDAVAVDNAFEGRVVVQAADDMPLGNCLMEWADGGAERDSAALWQEIDGIVAQSLGAIDAAAEAGAVPPPEDPTAVQAPPPEAAVPEDTQPEDTQPEDTQLEDTLPEDARPEDTQPEEAMPEESRPEDARPEDALSEDTQPEDAVDATDPAAVETPDMTETAVESAGEDADAEVALDAATGAEEGVAAADGDEDPNGETKPEGDVPEDERVITEEVPDPAPEDQ